MAKANKRLGLYIIRKRKERFNARAADIITSVNECTVAVNRIDKRLKDYFKQELDEKYKKAIQTEAEEDVDSYLKSKQEFIDFGGSEDELIKYQTQKLYALCSRAPIESKKEPKIKVALNPAAMPAAKKAEVPKKKLVTKK